MTGDTSAWGAGGTFPIDISEGDLVELRGNYDGAIIRVGEVSGPETGPYRILEVLDGPFDGHAYAGDVKRIINKS